MAGRRHPLNPPRRPGPRTQKERDNPGDAILQAAALAQDLTDSGEIAKGPPGELEPVVPIGPNGMPVRLLTREDERELSRRVQGWGDPLARDTFVLANLGLVRSWAAAYNRRPHIEFEDLEQVGVIGLLRAVETYDGETGWRFSTYAAYWIRAKLQRFVQKADKSDKYPIEGAEAEYDPDVGHRRIPLARALRLDEPTALVNGSELHEVLPDPAPNPEEALAEAERERRVRQAVNKAVQTRGRQARTIVEQRVLSDEPLTLAELGKVFGISREGARQHEVKLMREVARLLRHDDEL